jgi:Cu-processing system ATP-binding protein
VNGAPTDAEGDYRNAIGYMPQLARFPENLPVGDVIGLVSAFRAGVARDDELIEALHLVREMDRPVRTLSGGTRQKVSAAIAFLFHPAILILDEPTAGLDPLSASILKEKIRSVRAEGRTVLVTSHVSAELEGLCDDVAFLCDGELGFAGSSDALLHQVGERRLEGAIASLVRSRRGVA